MDEIRCSIKIEDRAEGEPARLVGVLMPYGTEARDRREVFEPGSLTQVGRGRWRDASYGNTNRATTDSCKSLPQSIVTANFDRMDQSRSLQRLRALIVRRKLGAGC